MGLFSKISKAAKKATKTFEKKVAVVEKIISGDATAGEVVETVVDVAIITSPFGWVAGAAVVATGFTDNIANDTDQIITDVQDTADVAVEVVQGKATLGDLGNEILDNFSNAGKEIENRLADVGKEGTKISNETAEFMADPAAYIDKSVKEDEVFVNDLIDDAAEYSLDQISKLGAEVNRLSGVTDSFNKKQELAEEGAALNTKTAYASAKKQEKITGLESLSYRMQSAQSLDASASTLANRGVALSGSQKRRQSLSQENVSSDIKRMNEDTEIIAQAMRDQADYDEKYVGVTGDLELADLNKQTGLDTIAAGIDAGSALAKILLI